MISVIDTRRNVVRVYDDACGTCIQVYGQVPYTHPECVLRGLCQIQGLSPTTALNFGPGLDINERPARS